MYVYMYIYTYVYMYIYMYIFLCIYIFSRQYWLGSAIVGCNSLGLYSLVGLDHHPPILLLADVNL